MLSARVTARITRRAACSTRPRHRALASLTSSTSLFAPLDPFSERHIGPGDEELSHMLKQLGHKSMSSFVDETVPPKIRVAENSISNETIPALSESELFRRAKALAAKNKVFKTYIGMGYHNAITPPVILRNVRSSAKSRRVTAYTNIYVHLDF